MYEEGNRGIRLNWGSLAIKLVILAVILFIAGWLFVKLIGNNNSSSSNTLASSSNDYITNINTMKTAAFEYFTQSKLPEKVGGTEKVTLAQMINQKLLIDFTDDGKSCDINSSYIQTTKTADGNYALKVSLTCDEKSDFIVTTIEGNNYTNTTNTDVVIDNTSSSSNNSSNNTSSNTTTSSNNSSSNTSSTSSSTTSNNTSSSNKVSSTTTKTTTTVKTTLTIKISCTSGCCQTNCGTTNTDKKDDTDTTPSTKTVRYYKHVKYSDWEDGKSSKSNAENKKVTYYTYNYCKVYNDTIYSTSYVKQNASTGKYSYEVRYEDLPSDVNKLTVSNASYFRTSLTDYSNYIESRGDLYMIGDKTKYQVSITNATKFRASSLKKTNFTYTVSDAYHYTGNDGDWVTLVTINYKNASNVDAYYASNLGYNVYFVPVKWDIEYTRDGKCYRDTLDNQDNYDGYQKSDKETETKWMHRTYEYKWSTEKSLSGYTYTGEYEDRTE